MLLLTLQDSRAQQLSVDDDSDSSEGTSDIDDDEAEEDEDTAVSAVSGGEQVCLLRTAVSDVKWGFLSWFRRFFTTASGQNAGKIANSRKLISGEPTLSQ